MITLKIKAIEEVSQIESIDSVIDLIDSQFKTYNVNKSAENIGDALKNALGQGSRCVLFIATNVKGEYIGFAFGNINSGLESGGDYLWINELFVTEENRGKGVGSSIIEYVEDWCRNKNIGYIACATGVKNDGAQKFYKSQDYDLCDTIWVDKELK